MIRCLASDLCELLVLAVFLLCVGCVAEAVMTARASIHSMPQGAVAYAEVHQ
jgi:serine protease inhibitor